MEIIQKCRDLPKNLGKRSPSICRNFRINLGKRSPSVCKMCTPAIFNASQNSEFLRVWFFSLAYNDQNVL